MPNLIAVQRDSFSKFLSEGLAHTFRDISPISDYAGKLHLELEFDPDDEGPAPTAQVHRGGVQGEGHDLLRADLRAGALLERRHG